jgi:predicted alpha/beta hydrolase family esterase
LSESPAYLILHGWQNRRPPEHWEHILALALRAEGADVAYPQLPSTDEPVLGDWIATARGALSGLGAGAVVLCHSLSCAMWAHLATGLEPGERPSRVLWVAPPGPSLFASEPAIAEFAFAELDPATVRASSSREPLRLVCSESGDPYCPEGAHNVYGGPMGLDVDLLQGQDHINPDAGYGEWPSVLEWCHDPAVRLVARAA